MKKIVRTVVITLLFALVSFYFTLPALNLVHLIFTVGCWKWPLYI